MDALLDVGYFSLLTMVCLHLVRFVLLLNAHVGNMITSAVDDLVLYRQIHDVCSNRVHDILPMRGDIEHEIACW
jgi:hypothetical protein